ncbi:MAG: ABC transporter ATP-binding protein [Lachnospiraceae bacterium]|nr:ABC transporter ATP-binding protein [Lachnospiraceae bacterium]
MREECLEIARQQREKQKNQFKETGAGKKSILLRLGKYLWRFKWLLIVAILLSISSNLLSLVGPRLSGYAIDAIELGEGNVDMDRVIYYCKAMVILFAVSSVLSYLLQMVMLQVTRKIVSTMRSEIFDHLLKLPVGFYDTHASGDIISRITYDVDTINTSLSHDVVAIFASVLTVIGSLIMMIVISPPLVLIFVVTVPISIVFIRKLSSITRPLFRARSGKLGELNGFIEEMFSGQKSLKAYHQEVNTIHKFQQKNQEAVDAYYRADYMGSMVGPSVNLINNISLALVTIFGAVLYLFNGISLGNISSFVLYSRRFSGPINESANIMSELMSALAAAERVFRLMDELPEKEDDEKAKILGEVYGDVELKHVDFSYVPERPLIRDLNLTADRGKLVAIVGPTGAGKTTIINLLMRFYDVNGGEITVDGHETRSVTRDSLRKSFAMVLQDTWLFHGTIFENIAYGNPDATLDDVIRVCRAARIHNYIMRLPQKYDTVLSDDGTNISKGQKQLLTIARAMLLDAHMLILDEATSNVDTRTEQQIQEAMLELMKGKTCFVIAHRLSTIRNADTILVVKDGQIVEQGTHDDLMEKKGFYRTLYDSQFAGQSI